LTFYIWGAYWRHLANTTEPSCTTTMRPYVKLLRQLVIIISRPHRSTTYVDAAYCYRSSSVLSICRSVGLLACRSVCTVVWAQKKRLNRSRCRLGYMGSDGPKELGYVLDGPRPPLQIPSRERGNFEGRKGGPLYSRL